MNLWKWTAAICLGALLGCTPDGNPPDRRPMPQVQQAANAGAARALLNAERAAKGLQPVRRSSQLTTAATRHARDMSAKRYFSHASANGDTLGDRVRAQGYGFCIVAENIAQGPASEADVIGGWMQSSGHRRNILNPGVTEFGLARAPGNYWVLVLARPGC
ncbi:MAG: CAP domain-containing protein [Paracoccaceae bacterium]